MHYPSTKLIDLHKYLVGLKLIDHPFIENQSYDTGSHLDDLREGNWFKNLPNEFPISRDLFFIFCIDFFYLWEFESTNKLLEVFNNLYSDDKEFVKNYLNEACVTNELFPYSSERLQSDYELLKLYLGFNDYYGANRIFYLHENIQSNRALMLKSLADFPNIFCDLNEEFRSDEKFATIAIKHNGLLLEFAGEKIKDNEKLVALAIKSNIKAVLFASKRLLEFPDGMFYEQYWHVRNDIELK